MLVLGFTIFNTATLLILALSAALLTQRLRLRLKGNWPAAYYAAAVGYAFGFPYSLNPFALFGGAMCALLLRFGIYHRGIRIAEVGVLIYAILRSLALLMGW